MNDSLDGSERSNRSSVRRAGSVNGRRFPEGAGVGVAVHLITSPAPPPRLGSTAMRAHPANAPGIDHVDMSHRGPDIYLQGPSMLHQGPYRPRGLVSTATLPPRRPADDVISVAETDIESDMSGVDLQAARADLVAAVVDQAVPVEVIEEEDVSGHSIRSSSAISASHSLRSGKTAVTRLGSQVEPDRIDLSLSDGSALTFPLTDLITALRTHLEFTDVETPEGMAHGVVPANEILQQLKSDVMREIDVHGKNALVSPQQAEGASRLLLDALLKQGALVEVWGDPLEDEEALVALSSEFALDSEDEGGELDVAKTMQLAESLLLFLIEILVNSESTEARTHPSFEDFQLACGDLMDAPVDELSRTQQVVFYLNVCNTLFLHVSCPVHIIIASSWPHLGLILASS